MGGKAERALWDKSKVVREDKSPSVSGNERSLFLWNYKLCD